MRDGIPSFVPPSSLALEFQAPLTPRTQRTLRKLQSAHNLGAAAKISSSSSTILTQQKLRDVHSRDISPTRRQALNRSPQRHRANSDASANAPTPGLRAASSSASLHVKRVALSRTVSAADTLSLERLIRDGPPDDDVGSALTNMRFKVLDQGIKSDMDGMVRLSRGTNKQAVWSLKLTMFSPRVGYTSG
jgi:cell cycle arrest protein BUB2